MTSPILAVPLMRGPTHTVYDGFIKVKGKEYQFRLIAPNEGNLLASRLQIDLKLQSRLVPYKDAVKQLLSRNTNVHIFLQELSNIIAGIEGLSAPEDVSPLDSDAAVYLLKQLEKVGWDKLESVDETFENLSLRLNDSDDRPHLLHLCLPTKSDGGTLTCTTDLPISTDFHISKDKESSLDSLLQQFKLQIERCEDFWSVMSEIDGKTWVLEPEKPTPSITHRRIAIATNASLQIKVDPLHPRMFPECKFLGADKIINPLKERLNTNVHKWNTNFSILDNLQTVLEISFPSPEDTSREQLSTECGICYSYRLDDTTPDRVCDDPRCGHAFHQLCLYEWLRALPTSRQSFNMIFGECPFCCKPITVKMSSSS